MKQTTFIVLIALISLTGCAQTTSQKNKPAQRVGGSCEGCEAIHESPVAFEKLPNVITLPDYNEKGPKIEVSGVVYQQDGKTPAKDVVIYVYHTDQTGHYSAKTNAAGWGKRHGYIRGWMKTNEKGEYTFYTLRPAAYPGRKDPAHIHVSIKEPGKNEYWIDAYLFDNDPLLTVEERKRLEDRGGSGILSINADKAKNIGRSKRDIYLGKNVPNYPAN